MSLKSLTLISALASALCVTPAAAQAPEKAVFSTNWKAQAEHGGYYQAVADGSYRKCGLEVDIRQVAEDKPLLCHPTGGTELVAKLVLVGNVVARHTGCLRFRRSCT